MQQEERLTTSKPNRQLIEPMSGAVISEKH